jgi:pimeloyl-ACP methyl ester carboxylesterase
MPRLNLGTFEIEYQEYGASGEPVVLVHGSWGDRRQWDAVVARLAESCRVISYDRRGHGASTSPGGSVAIANHVGDLSTLLTVAGRGARHVVGTGEGGVIALQLALTRPDLVRSVHAHEPSLLGLLSADPQAHDLLVSARSVEAAAAARLGSGDPRGAASTFVDGSSAAGEGWDAFPPAVQTSFTSNALASSREVADPTTQTMELSQFTSYRDPVLLTTGGRSAAAHRGVTDRVADAFYRPLRYQYPEGGHFPHVTRPDECVRVVAEFCQFARQQTG